MVNFVIKFVRSQHEFGGVGDQACSLFYCVCVCVCVWAAKYTFLNYNES